MKVKAQKYIEKPWGSELWIAVNDNYALKKIFLKKGQRTSLQFHQFKTEHVYILEGKLLIEEDDKDSNLVATTYQAGEIAYSPPLAKHRLTALEDTSIIEVSTPFLDDVIRIEDDYARV